MTKRSIPVLAILQAFLLPLPAAALTATVADCSEAADFIGNAARSRDNGLSSEAFFARFDGDLELLKALPPEVRWFVKDDDDEALLRAGAIEVFARRRQPDEHALDFLIRCREAIDAGGVQAPLPESAEDAT